MGSTAGLALLWMGPAGGPADAAGGPAAALADRLAAELPGWQVRVLTAPWDDWRALQGSLAGPPDRPVVVAAPAGPAPADRVLDVAVRAGLDCARVHVVDPQPGSSAAWPPAAAAAARAARLVAAAAARAAAGRDTPAAALRLRLPSLTGSTSRRSLLDALRPRYEVIPRVDPAACRGAGGCRLCAAACPAGAIAIAGGTAAIRADACSGCSICSAACPTGAIAHPEATIEMVEAQVSALLAPGAPQPPVIAYACPTALAVMARLSGQAGGVPDSVMPVPVPCAAAVPPYLLLRPLELGAAAVAVLACPARCRFGAAADAVDRPVWFASDLLRCLGTDPGRVARLPADPAAPGLLAADLAFLAAACTGAPPLPGAAAAAASGRRGGFAALGSLVQRQRGDGRLAGAHVPFGRVALEPERCTFCGLCAAACPTGALALAGGDPVQLRLSAVDCAGCAACSAACPEQAIAVTPGLDLAEVQEPVRILGGDQVQRCPACGARHAPASLTARVRARLLGTAGLTGTDFLDYCPACRLGAGPRRKDRERSTAGA